jgi:AraC-like DNA-binding protein
MQNRQDWVPIIIVADTVTTDMLGSSGVIQPHLNRPVLEDGFRCSTLASGKHYAVHYPPGNLSRMSSLLQLQSIRKKLLPQRIPGAEMLSALDVLFRRNPLSVETWSGHLNSTPRKLQQLFKEYTLYTPKKLIALYHAYRIAFEAAARQDEKGKGIIPAYLLDERSRKRVMEYILSRRSQFLLA